MQEIIKVKVDNIMTTSQFERGIKRLIKAKKFDTLNDIQERIAELAQVIYNPNLHQTKLEGKGDRFHIHAGTSKVSKDTIIIYRYVDDMLIISLELDDIVNHNELSKYQEQNYNIKHIIELKNNELTKEQLNTLTKRKGDSIMKKQVRDMNRRSGYYVEVEFSNPRTKNSSKEYAYLDFDLLMDTFVEWSEQYKDVRLDGINTDIYNLFNSGDRDMVDYLIDHEDTLQEMLREAYLDSGYYEEDYEKWLDIDNDDYDYLHQLGEYSE